MIMLRKLVRDGIRATASGRDPQGVTRVEGRVIRTYAQDTVVHLPPGATPEAERQQLLDVGRKVMDDFYVKNPPASISREALRASGVT